MKRRSTSSPADIDYSLFENIPGRKLLKEDIHDAALFAASYCAKQDNPVEVMKEILDCIGYERLMESAV